MARRLMRLSAAFAAATILLGCGQAKASRQDFTIINRTGLEIARIYVSAGPDRSGGMVAGDPLQDLHAINITFGDATMSCQWDLHIIYQNGATATWHDLNLCGIDKIELFWNKLKQKTAAHIE